MSLMSMTHLKFYGSVTLSTSGVSLLKVHFHHEKNGIFLNQITSSSG